MDIQPAVSQKQFGNFFSCARRPDTFFLQLSFAFLFPRHIKKGPRPSFQESACRPFLLGRVEEKTESYIFRCWLKSVSDAGQKDDGREKTLWSSRSQLESFPAAAGNVGQPRGGGFMSGVSRKSWSKLLSQLTIVSKRLHLPSLAKYPPKRFLRANRNVMVASTSRCGLDIVQANWTQINPSDLNNGSNWPCPASRQ